MHDPNVNEQFSLPNAAGLLRPGNINLTRRPLVRNPRGGISTVDSISFGIGPNEVLVPSVVNGRVVSPALALAAYRRTGQNLGTFASPAAANRYARLLHEQQAAYYADALARAAADH